MTRPPIFFSVPAATPQAECRSCRAPIYWIITGAGHRMPIDCAVEGGSPPTDGRSVTGDQYLPALPGRGVSHFATCPNAAQHRQPRRRP